ncbi:MAG: hypothetical protein AAF533_01285 [Acidobacteriota bacterium]
MLEVECHSGHRGDEEPRLVVLDGKRLAAEVIDRWYHGAPGCEEGTRRIFKLRLEDGRELFIEQETGSGVWRKRPESPVGRTEES